MKKVDIIDGVYEHAKPITRRRAAEAVELVLEAMKKELEKGEKVKIHAFGTFSVRSVGERIARNPRTGEEVTVAPTRAVAFRPAQVLKDSLNEEPG